MIRLILALALVVTFLNAKESINKKISKTNTQLSTSSKNYTKINREMAKNAKAILKQKRELSKQTKYLKKLKIELKDKESSYKANTLQLESLKKTQNELVGVQDNIEEELVFLIAQSVSLSVIVEDEKVVNAESLIEFEVLNSMLKASKKKVKKLNKKFFTNSNDIKVLAKHAASLKKAIEDIDAKRTKLLKTQNLNKLALKSLNNAKASYKKKVKTILKKQDT